MNLKNPRVAIVGATGAVGVEILSCLESRNFPLASLKLLASHRSAGKQVAFRGKMLTVEELTKDSFSDVDIALFSAGGDISREFAPIAGAAGCVVIDNSSAFRQDDDVPLVVPEINADAAFCHPRNIIANPNCTTIITLMALYPLHLKYGLKMILASSYQAVSGSGQHGITELENQVRALVNGHPVEISTYPRQIAFNVLPQIDKFTDTGIPDYTILTAADFTAEAKPYRNSDGTYRYIVNPAAQPVSLTGTYDNGKKEFTVTPNGIVTGNYKTYKVDGAKTDEKSHELQVGDYLLADGNLVGKDETLTTGQQADVIAIVFHAGHHANDGSNYSATGIGQQKCQGYAVSLTDATSSYCMWGVYGAELGCFPTDGSEQDNYSTPDIDWSGYAWTQKIITAAGGKGKLNATEQSGYPATWYAVVDYETKVKAPANSSGWFLPSIGQM